MLYLNLTKLRQEYKLSKRRNPILAERLFALIEYEKVRINHDKDRCKIKQNMKIQSLCLGLDTSLRTLQRWRKAYKEKGLYGLNRKKNKGSPALEISLKAKRLIENYRKDYLWGAEVIGAHLEFDDGIKLSRYKIDRYLTESGLKEEYPCLPIKKYKNKKVKHNKKVKVEIPGMHTQIDVNHQPHILKHKSYVYNFVDHATNWSYKKSYRRICPASSVDFLREILKYCPFKIFRIQSDNGHEFTYRFLAKYEDDPKPHPFTMLCESNEIAHKLIPPGEKELQGLVERSHRQDKQELFHRINPSSLNDFNFELKYYNNWRNNFRRFKKLGWKAPMQSVSEFIVKTLVVCLHYKNEDERLNIYKQVEKNNRIRSGKFIKGILTAQNHKKAS
jgi:transposase